MYILILKMRGSCAYSIRTDDAEYVSNWKIPATLYSQLTRLLKSGEDSIVQVSN